MSEERKLCSHLNEDGTQCRGTSTGDGFCPYHSPRFTDEQKAEWRTAGGNSSKRKSLTPAALPTELNNLDDVAKLLRLAMARVATGELDPVIANSMSGIAITLGKLQGQTKFETELAELRTLVDKLKKRKGIDDGKRPESRTTGAEIRGERFN